MPALAVLLLALASPCDPLGSSGDAVSCSLCDRVDAICSSPRAERAKVAANAACSLHPDVIRADDDRMWLVDLACDASKIAYGAGALGVATLSTGNTSLSAEEQWASLLSVCEAGATRRAWRSCPPRTEKFSYGRAHHLTRSAHHAG